jgi:hypothetical protein
VVALSLSGVLLSLCVMGVWVCGDVDVCLYMCICVCVCVEGCLLCGKVEEWSVGTRLS